MAVGPGQSLSHYRLVEKIGEGGMGMVWKAVDTRLARDVAIKVLPDAFARDAERLARFEKEAKLLASLNHPNIAAIHGLEEAEGVRFLALELVPGESLANRLARGPLPVEEALVICRQVAEALESAHESGVIHRDLKPANIMIAPGGKVKVLDFGLAKAFEARPAGADPSLSPTATMGGTRDGVILGTAAYMSPEQARGKPLDRRTDIWSFGCVLYEALTGRQAFGGETITDILATILKQDVNWNALPADTPLRARELLWRCLRKDPHVRLHSMADARIEMEEALAEPGPPASIDSPASPQVVPTSKRRSALPWALVVLLGITTLIAIQVRQRNAPPLTRLSVTLPDSARLTQIQTQPVIDLSPDGKQIVYVGQREQGSQLYIRGMDEREPRPIPGTQGGMSPFFSPDGQSVGFVAEGKLKQVSLRGGAPRTICDAESPRGASWGPDGTIIFTPRIGAALYRVPATGGQPEQITQLDREQGEDSHRWPQVVSGGGAVVFSVWHGSSVDHSEIIVQSLETGERKTVIEGGTYARYLPTGHLVFLRFMSLHAVPFDLDALEVTGPRVTLLDEVAQGHTGHGDLAFSANGTLVYSVTLGALPNATLVRMDFDGNVQPLAVPQRRYWDTSFSPDGSRLAASITEGTRSDIWSLDLERGASTRLTFDGFNMGPIWTPDGTKLAFLSTLGPRKTHIRLLATDGSGETQQLTPHGGFQMPTSWSPDGRVLLFSHFDPDGEWDIWMVTTDGGEDPRPFLKTPFRELGARFSLDGSWVAYTSDASGRNEVYVRPFPGPGSVRQVSTAGGAHPIWAADGGEIFFIQGNKVMTVPVETGAEFRAGTPRVLIDAPYRERFYFSPNYDVAPDGTWLVMIRPEVEDSSTEIHVVQGWFEEVERLVVPSGR
jgi:serine/threonine-protein kinase